MTKSQIVSLMIAIGYLWFGITAKGYRSGFLGEGRWIPAWRLRLVFLVGAAWLLYSAFR